MNKSKINSIIFISNFFNHHQKPFSEEMYKRLGKGFLFIETDEISEERKKLGWGETVYPEYVVSKKQFYSNKERYIDAINNADVVIVGDAPREILEERDNLKKLIFRYAERPLKKVDSSFKYLFRLYTWRKHNLHKKHVYMLCASAYTATDYNKHFLYIDKCFKWGYFPATKKYEDVDALISKKQKASIVWVARLIDWKHPEVCIEVAKKLKQDNRSFALNIIGTGPLEDELKKLIKQEHLEDCVHMLGAMKPEAVREHMEKSQIFIFTSDRGEGWGAVLNESMNSACAVVASHAIGSVPFLIEDGKNGCIYKDGDIDDLYKKVKFLLDDDAVRDAMSKNAYYTMVNEWNAENAVKKFLTLAEHILEGEKGLNLFTEGVCSKAKALKDNWYF